MLARYCGPGLLGLGITALIAGFMSGMAGNVSAFATVWTYDIYRALIKKDATDAALRQHGPLVHGGRRAFSIGTAYLVMHFKSIMDYVQALFSFFIAPLFGTVLLGMLWKRATPAGGFWGLLAGTVSSIGMWAWVKIDPRRLRYVALSPEREGHGGEHVPRAVVVDRVRVGDGGRQLGDQAQAGRGTDGAGVRRHRNSVGRPCLHASSAQGSGRRWWPYCLWF